MQIFVKLPKALGYLHLKGKHGGYHLLLSGVTIGLSVIKQKNLWVTSLHPDQSINQSAEKSPKECQQQPLHQFLQILLT